MKKLQELLFVGMIAACLTMPSLAADSRDDYQVIKKAVKDNPGPEAGKEVKWFKLLVTDNRTKKDKVRLTLPVSLVEVFIKCADHKRMKIHREECDIDIAKIFNELKQLGPLAIIEIYEDDETVKVWLE